MPGNVVNNEIFKIIENQVRGIFCGAAGHHDWDHTERVLNLCLRIGKTEKADLEILGLAALLHDIGREEETKSKGGICHAELSAKMAEEILTEQKLKREKIEEILHCIICHRNKNRGKIKTLEAKILFDANKLDSLGAIAIGRLFMFAQEHGGRLHNPEVDLSSVADYSKEDTPWYYYATTTVKIFGSLFTPEARRIAKERDAYMKNFFNRLDGEVSGKL